MNGAQRTTKRITLKKRVPELQAAVCHLLPRQFYTATCAKVEAPKEKPQPVFPSAPLTVVNAPGIPLSRAYRLAHSQIKNSA